MAHKAKTGGEIGANGEFYKGGQFVADSENTIKGSNNSVKSSHRIQIEPYKWIEADKTVLPVMVSAGIGTVSRFENGNNKDYSKIILIENAQELCNRNKWNIEIVKSFISRYNNGERVYTK